MPRRRYFGTIEYLGKDSDGMAIWRIRWYDNGVRRSECVHGKRCDAERKLAAHHAASKRRKASGMTVGDIYRRYYVPDSELTKAPRTRRRLYSAWDSKIAPRWDDVPVSRVKAMDVENWLQDLAPSTAANALAILRWIMHKAVMLDQVESSPLDMRISVPHGAHHPQSHEIITAATIDAYYDAVRGSLAEAAWILCIAGGLRPGESLGVKADEPELREMNGTPFVAVPVSRQANSSGGVHIDDRDNSERLKTRTSLRWAIVLEPWASRLMALCEAAKSRQDAYLTDDGLGEPFGTAWLYRTLSKLYADNNLSWVTTRNLRASYATSAHYELALPTEDVARLMGHSKPIITWDTYERPNLDQIAASVIRRVD